MMMTLAFSAGTTSIVSRYCGAGDAERAVQAGRQALLCAIALSIIATTAGLTLCRTILQAIGASDNVEDQGVLYLNMCLLSMVPYTVLWITNSIFRASGDARTPMVTMMLVFGSIMICETVLCTGPLKFGIAGIGISWILSSSAGMTINLIKLRHSSLSAVCDLKGALSEGI